MIHRTRKFLVIALAFALVVMLAMAWHLRIPVAPWSGDTLRDADRVVRPATVGITVGSYNIHGGKGVHGTTAASEFARILSVPPIDVAALNEVTAGIIGRDNQAAAIARELGAAWLFAPTATRLIAQEHGNGLVARIAIDSFEVTPLPWRHLSRTGLTSGNSHRNVITATTTVDGVATAILATHLDRGPLRLRQLDAVIDRMQQYPHAILMGDLNSTHADVLPRLEGTGITESVAIGEPDHEDHIDYILVRGFEPVASGNHPVGPSDHPYYWAKLRLRRDGASR